MAEQDYRIERLTGRPRPGLFMAGTNSPGVIDRWKERRRLKEEVRAARQAYKTRPSAETEADLTRAVNALDAHRKKKPSTGHEPAEG